MRIDEDGNLTFLMRDGDVPMTEKECLQYRRLHPCKLPDGSDEDSPEAKLLMAIFGDKE